jgi:hypothetical protein
LFHDIVETHSSSSVRLVKRHAHGVEGKGHAKFGLNGSIKKITNDLYVLGMKNNLISIGVLANKGHLVVFNTRRCFILDE